MPSKDEEADFTKAYKDLVEAEKTAATLETQLNLLEQNLDNFLAEHDKEEEGGWVEKESKSSSAVPMTVKEGIKKVEGT